MGSLGSPVSVFRSLGTRCWTPIHIRSTSDSGFSPAGLPLTTGKHLDRACKGFGGYFQGRSHPILVMASAPEAHDAKGILLNRASPTAGGAATSVYNFAELLESWVSTSLAATTRQGYAKRAGMEKHPSCDQVITGLSSWHLSSSGSTGTYFQV
jgi:hypothetical protein